MKRLLHFVTIAAAGALFATSASAQSFHVQDTVKSVVAGFSEVHNDIHNMSSGSIQVTWKVIDHNLPADWIAVIGVCDNITCYGQAIIGKPGPSKTTANIAMGGMSMFDVQINVTNLTAGGPYYLTVELTESTTIDTATFWFYKWPTGIANIEASKDGIAVYPNPAGSEINVASARSDVRSVVIVNALGSVVGRYPAAEKITKINMQGFTPGVYFVKMLNGQNDVAAIRRIVHQ